MDLQITGNPGRHAAGRHAEAENGPAARDVCAVDDLALRDGVPQVLTFHLEAGTGPMVNPFPLARARRAHGHHNPMDRFPQRVRSVSAAGTQRVPRQIADAVFNELFARLPSIGTGLWWRSGFHRCASVGTAGCAAREPIPGQQLITVIRKGSRALQQLPASPDAFVWLRLYQQEMHGLVPAGPDDPCGGRCGGRSGR